MGTGHIMRMIALAQAWRDRGGKALFLCADITPALEERIDTEGFHLETLDASAGSRADLLATFSLVARHSVPGPATSVVLDGYQFDSDFQLGLKKQGYGLLVVDDYGHAGSYHADIVLNQNISAREALYSKSAAGSQLLLGPSFALLRREFLDQRKRTRPVPDRASNLLVTLGGADADNVTKKVIDALAGSGLAVKVAVGGSNPHLSTLRQAAEAVTNGATRVELMVNTSDTAGLMQWADMAVAAAGSTSWELAYNGVPPILIILADNQRENAMELEKQGFGLCIGEHSDFDPNSFCVAIDRLASDSTLRASFALRGQGMVDGFGAHRVASCLAGGADLELQVVNEADFKLLWEWANDSATRANSFESSPIPWERHKQWCYAKLGDAQCRLWMATNSELGKFGVVRFNCHGAEATISVSLAPDARGKGYGKKLIEAACDRIFSSSEVSLIRALIKPANKASLRSFERAGFRRDVGTMVKGQPAEQYLLYRTS